MPSNHRSLSILATVAVLCAAAACLRNTPAATPEHPPGTAQAHAAVLCWNPDAGVALTGASCTPLTPPQLSCYLPSDLQGGVQQEPASTVQRSADLFSWQEFIALNWPASDTERGVPDRSKPLGAPGPRVWETWKETYEVYLPDGRRPPGWNDTQPLPSGCGADATKLLTRDEKIDDVTDSALQAAASDGRLPATLTDRRGHLVRYEIRMNRPMFEHILDNGLYDGRRQVDATLVSFPNGGILVKAAWRPVDAAEAPYFHTVTACVCDGEDGGRLTGCHPERMGLVGFHVTQKTPSAPAWVWSTFEQRANVRESEGQPASFFDPKCRDCVPNRQTKPGVPNQVVRVTPIPSSAPDCDAGTAFKDDVVRLNEDLIAALADAGSVFQHYELVDTQVPVASPYAAPQPTTVFGVSRPVLANTTMETFVQETSTCIGCHSTARTLKQEAFISADFTFSLNNAWPKPDASTTLPPPESPQTQWDREHWPQVLRGQAIAAQTYELLPQYTRAKLHCASCHLSEGRDPDAAWWVGMHEAYDGGPALQARINSCFEHSENGKALCTPGDGGTGSCDSNADMQALLTYMTWLDEQWAERHGTQTPPRGYPAIPTLTGDASRGRGVFQQKCAVCHGSDGQGRYPDGTYYRPALWGPNSFNAQAGMGNPSLSAPFVHANMPLGSGGLLTVEEAWDVAAFIDSQPRPGRGDGGTR
ncbi:c-type cytochrome [Pyxidicoccus sp. MSG2]|uniref:c-type cytochrome n=1 Tax=Pyxidicoccus sp. MSG2 TaxID=2996790 RepID=UPI0022705B27|nr:c-type cytochrome [Pyxidicoccus sp. MSG2]MCY1017963.1 c-type cytochrome [Pyxidicoccus sp. MSG2]